MIRPLVALSLSSARPQVAMLSSMYHCHHRHQSSNAKAPNPVPQIFNREHKRLHRDRAAKHPNSRTVDYLRDEIASRLVDRLLDIKRDFKDVMDLGSGAGHIVKFLDEGRCANLAMVDMSGA